MLDVSALLRGRFYWFYSVSLHFQLLYQTILIKYILARNVTNTKCIRFITLKRNCVYANNYDVFVQFGTKKTCKVFKNQLNCTSPEVLNLPVLTFSNCTKKNCGYLLIIYRKKIKRKVMIIVQRTHV